MSKLLLEVLADSNNLLKNLDRAQTSVDRFTKASDTAGHALGGGVNQALDAFEGLAKGGATAAGVLAGGLVAAATAAVLMTTSAGEQVEAIDQLSQKTGIAVQSIQSWSVVMAENGVQAETLTGGMRTLSKQVIDARDPASTAAATFDRLGIALTALGSTESVIRAVADKFKDMPNGADKARVAVELFGNAGLEMIPMLNRGSAAFDESRQAAERFAAVLSTHQVHALESADDAMDRLGVASGALKNQLGAIFAPGVELGAKLLASTFGLVAQAVRSADTALDTLFIRLSHTALAVNELADVLFSKDVLSGSAWQQALDNIKQIDAEAARLITKRRELTDVHLGLAQDTHVADFSRMNFELTKMDVALAMADAAMKRFISSQAGQEHIGQAIVRDAQDQLAARKFLASFALSSAKELVAQELALQQAYAATHEAGQRARFLSGTITPTAFAQDQAAASLEAIDVQVFGVKRLIEAEQQALDKQLGIAQATNAAEASIIQTKEESYARQAALDAQLVVLANQRRSAGIAGSIAISEAFRQEETTRLTALEAVASAELRIAQASFADVSTLRALRLTEIQTGLDRELAAASLTAAQRLAIERKAEADRMAVVQQFPTFFEQQMQAIVSSNSFSMGMMVSTWSGGIAQMAVRGGNLKAIWDQTLVALVQGFINSLAQMVAQWALHSTIMQTGATALEAAKTTIFGTGEAARLGISKANNALMSASSVAALGSMVAMGTGAMAVMTSVMLAASAMMAAIAGALGAGIVTAELAPAVAAASGVLAVGAGTLGAAGIGAIQAAAGAAIVAATSSGLGFSSGGIGDFGAGTPATLHGREAIIPLNGRGAAFMQEAFGAGGGGSRPIQNRIYLDKRVFAEVMTDAMPGAWRTMGARS